MVTGAERSAEAAFLATGAPSAALAASLAHLVTPEMDEKQAASRVRIRERNARLDASDHTPIPEATCERLCGLRGCISARPDTECAKPIPTDSGSA